MVVDGVAAIARMSPKNTHWLTTLIRWLASPRATTDLTVESGTLKKVWLKPTRGFLSDEFYNMAGLGALYSRASSYIFADWNKCGELMGLAPYGRPTDKAALEDQGWRAGCS